MIVLSLVVAVVSFVAFSPGLFGPFLWDDKPLILGNVQVRSLSAWRSWFTTDFWDVNPEQLQGYPRVHYFRPLVTASYALEYRLVGGEPFLFHLDNVVAHAVASVLAFFTLRRWTGTLAPAFIGALLFAVHPTKAESVAWIAGRTDVLCAIFLFAASAGAALRLRGRRAGLVVEIVATVLAYLTKEGAIVLPALVAFEAWVAFERPAIDGRTARRVVVAAAPQLLVAGAYLAARAALMPLRPTMPIVSPSDHAQMVLESAGRYVTLAIAPHDLSGQQALLRTLEGRVVHATGYVVLGAAAIAVLLAVALLARTRRPAWTMGIALFAALIFPVSNVVLTGLSTLVAERFLYLATIAVAFFAATFVEEARRRARDAVVLGAASLVVACSAFAALGRAIDFSDEARFWTRERALHPESVEALRYLIGRALEQRRYPTAEALALDARAQAARWYRHNGSEADFIVQLMEVRALLTPDRAVARLRAIDDFHRSLLDPTASVASIETDRYRVELPLSGVLRDRVRALRSRIAAARADIQSRLGEDAAARALVEDARRACDTCPRPAIVGALAAARAGDYAAARASVAAVGDRPEAKALEESIAAADVLRRQAEQTSGPIALNLRAMELAKLEAWGRAYAVLTPYRAQIELAPGFAIGFAELAFRAGDAPVARAVLAKQVPQEKIAPMIEEWARKMGWIE
ncbi:MAG: hypothetical protein HYV09_08990 [Deltaproteobacteria bacterium]|nr:hypothetical protein [Deltaproteobacteria bacterium]